MYNFLNSRISNSSFNKVFEIKGDSQHYYVFTQNNKQVNSKDLLNPVLSEISLTRFN